MDTVTISLKRGDNNEFYVKYPEDLWSEGGTLFFMAKPEPDNDATDAEAVIDKSYTDSDIVDENDPQNEEGYVVYKCTVDPDNTNGIEVDENTSRVTLSGEISYKNAAGDVASFPQDDNFIQVIVYADIRREDD